MYKFPLESYGSEIMLIDELIITSSRDENPQIKNSVPGLYWGDFVLPSNATVNPPLDTFLDLKGWFKVRYVYIFFLSLYLVIYKIFIIICLSITY
jgi:hypothetical protein